MTTTTETTAVDVGTPPQATFPAVTWKGENVPHRDLPHTGGDTVAIVGIALVMTLVGVVLVRWARRRCRRYVVKQGLNHWWVWDQVKGRAVVAMPNKEAARSRAAVLNANIPSLADSKGWKA